MIGWSKNWGRGNYLEVPKPEFKSVISSNESMSSEKTQKLTGPESPHFCTDGDTAEDVQGWTEIEEGRFMPRRVRGSGRGRALG